MDPFDAGERVGRASERHTWPRWLTQVTQWVLVIVGLGVTAIVVWLGIWYAVVWLTSMFVVRDSAG